MMRIVAVLAAMYLIFTPCACSSGAAPARVIPLPRTTGRIDHMDFDERRNRLYIAAHDAGRLIIVDTVSGSVIKEITGLKEPQGVLYARQTDRILVTNGADGSVTAFSGSTLALIKTIHFESDADNIRPDTASGLAYVGHGDGGIGIIQLDDLQRVQDIRLDGHPEAFALDGKKHIIYVNIPATRKIALIDMNAGKVTRTWKLSSARENYSLAMNDADRELFVGCREPAVILVFDADSGHNTQTIDISGDIDDLYYDPSARRLYASCGSGVVHVFRQAGSHRYVPVAKLLTGAGARTCLLVPSKSALFVAVPSSGKKKARILVFSTLDRSRTQGARAESSARYRIGAFP